MTRANARGEALDGGRRARAAGTRSGLEARSRRTKRNDDACVEMGALNDSDLASKCREMVDTRRRRRGVVEAEALGGVGEHVACTGSLTCAVQLAIGPSWVASACMMQPNREHGQAAVLGSLILSSSGRPPPKPAGRNGRPG